MMMLMSGTVNNEKLTFAALCQITDFLISWFTTSVISCLVFHFLLPLVSSRHFSNFPKYLTSLHPSCELDPSSLDLVSFSWLILDLWVLFVPSLTSAHGSSSVYLCSQLWVGVGVGGGVKVRVKTRLKGRQSSSTPLFVHCCSFLPLLALAHSPLTCSSHLFTAISQHSLRWHSKEDSARACSVENPTSLKGYFFPKPTEASLRGFLMSVENVRVVPGSN